MGNHIRTYIPRETDEASPEARVVEGVQVRRVQPADVVAFAAQLQVPPRRQSCALAQAQEVALIQHLCQMGLTSPSSILQFGVAHPHPFAAWPGAVLSRVFPAFDLLAGTWTHRGGRVKFTYSVGRFQSRYGTKYNLI